MSEHELPSRKAHIGIDGKRDGSATQPYCFDDCQYQRVLETIHQPGSEHRSEWTISPTKGGVQSFSGGPQSTMQDGQFIELPDWAPEAQPALCSAQAYAGQRCSSFQKVNGELVRLVVLSRQDTPEQSWSTAAHEVGAGLSATAMLISGSTEKLKASAEARACALCRLAREQVYKFPVTTQ